MISRILPTLIIGCLIFTATSCRERQKLPTDNGKSPVTSGIEIDIEDYSDSVKKYHEYMCDCIKTEDTKHDVIALAKRYDSCLKMFVINNASDVQHIVKDLSTMDSIPLDEYSVGYDFGKELSRKGNTLLAKNCAFFRTEFRQLKETMMRSIGVDESNVESMLELVKGKIQSSENRVELGNLYALQGILYEYAGQKKRGRESFQKGVDLDNSSSSLCQVFIGLQ